MLFRSYDLIDKNCTHQSTPFTSCCVLSVFSRYVHCVHDKNELSVLHASERLSSRQYPYLTKSFFLVWCYVATLRITKEFGDYTTGLVHQVLCHILIRVY